MLILALAAVLAAGCAPASPATPTPAPPVQSTPEAAPATPAPTETVVINLPIVEKPVNSTPAIPFPQEGALKELASGAREDLAKRLNVPAGEIELLELSRVTWRDGSLGCPKPGMMYTMALVNGTLIRLRAGGVVYEYHSGGQKPAFLCEKPDKPLPEQ